MNWPKADRKEFTVASTITATITIGQFGGVHVEVGVALESMFEVRFRGVVDADAIAGGDWRYA